VPVGALQSAALLRREADAVVCPNELADLVAVGLWYRAFDQVGDAEVVALLESADLGSTAGL
jgi:predicted phosphoribosyltransferase